MGACVSALRLASGLLDEAAVVGSRQGEVFLRLTLWLSMPALLVGLATLALDPQEFLTGGVSDVELSAAQPAAAAILMARAVALYAPIWLVTSLCALALEGATVLAGWQLLHGRPATLRGVLLGLYDRRWAVVGVVCAKGLLIGAGQVVLMLPAAGALFFALVGPQSADLVLLMEGVPFVAVLMGVMGAPVVVGVFVFSLAMPAVMVEEFGPIAALRRSFDLLRRRWSLSIWTWLLAVAIGSVIMLNVEALVAATGLLETHAEGGPMEALTSPRVYISSQLVGLAAVPVKALVLVALYQVLRANPRYPLDLTPSVQLGQRS